MKQAKKRIVLKISGEIFCRPHTRILDKTIVHLLIEQMKQLVTEYQWSIVVGGGNFFRGNEDSALLGLQKQTGHSLGMQATLMNGLILQDLCVHYGLKTSLFCADGFLLGKALTQQTLHNSLEQDECLIFSGGMGVPFFTTDTTAVVRALQIESEQIWKLTKVNGVYSEDPLHNPSAQLLKSVDYATALQDNLKFMDATALVLAQQYHRTIRVFSMYEPESLIKAVYNADFGSTITSFKGNL